MLDITSEGAVLARVQGRVGRLSLNRPGALNALDLSMVQAITAALVAWRDDPTVEGVMIDHAGARGFCAGGDVRALATGGEGLVRDFFLAEYRMNHLIYAYPKPTLAVMDGITMGGGVGLSWPCRYRLATERTVLAMPEGTIGLFPDVGMGWRLPRLPGSVGLWMALTGARLGPADALLVGLATDYAPSARLEAVKAAFVADPARVEGPLTELEGDAGDPPVSLVRDDIDRLFGLSSVEAIMAALERDGSPWAQEQFACMAKASPTTLKVAFRLLSEGARAHTLAEEMVTEYRLASRIGASREFREGVRAQLIDKDRQPRWDPATPGAVDKALLDALFAPLPAGEDWTPLP